MNDMYLVLPSNACASTQPDNIASKYIINWNNPITLDGNWKAALVEFNCTYSPCTLKKGARIESSSEGTIYYDVNGQLVYNGYEVVLDKMSGGSLIRIAFDSKGYLQFLGPPYFYITFPDIESAEKLGYNTLNVHSNKTGLIASKKMRSDMEPFKIYIRFDYTETSELKQYVVFEENYTFDNALELCNLVYKKCSEFFTEFKIQNSGLIEFKIKTSGKGGERKISFLDGLQYIFGMQHVSYTGCGISHSAISRPRLANAFTHLYIYSSLIESIHVGEMKAPLLKTIWLDKPPKYGETFSVDIKNPMYIPVAQNSINNIEINIRSDSGELISFSESDKSSLTIHLKKI
jgi:hypothetical protein